MKRNMDDVRRLLLAIEALPFDVPLQQLEGMSEDRLQMYAQWLTEAGLVDGRPLKIAGYMGVRIERLTWQGCDFLDAMRSDTLWGKAKAAFKSGTVDLPLAVLSDWLQAEIKRSLPSLGA